MCADYNFERIHCGSDSKYKTTAAKCNFSALQLRHQNQNKSWNFLHFVGRRFFGVHLSKSYSKQTMKTWGCCWWALLLGPTWLDVIGWLQCWTRVLPFRIYHPYMLNCFVQSDTDKCLTSTLILWTCCWLQHCTLRTELSILIFKSTCYKGWLKMLRGIIYLYSNNIWA